MYDDTMRYLNESLQAVDERSVEELLPKVQRALSRNFSALRAYHACKPVSLAPYYEQGIITYYQAPPRHLRYLVVLMRDAGLANKDLKLPQEWDEPLRSKSSLRTAKEKAEAIPVRTKLQQLIAVQKE